MVRMLGARDFTSTSFLNHHDARAANREDKAEPEQAFLTLTVPDSVFDRVWRELDSGVLPKMLRVAVRVFCLIEGSWMQQYYIQPGSVNIAEPLDVHVRDGDHLRQFAIVSQS